MKTTRVLITNPPWIVREGLFGKRLGIRAGSRWPFTAEAGLFSFLLGGSKKKLTQGEEIPGFYPGGGFKWWKENFKRNPFKTAINFLDTVINQRRYIPYPVFMGYATTYLQSKGVEAKFYDAIALNHNYRRFFKEVRKFNPEIIIQETSTPSFDVDIQISQRLHEMGYEVCLTGSHATAFAEELIKLTFVDYVLKGEYEYSSLEMLESRKRGVYSPVRPVDLDSLPYPYRDEKIIHAYREYCCRKDLDFPQLWIYGSRGCAFRCEFCLWVHTMFNKRFSLRKPKNILAEVDEMLRKYNFKYIMFDDDCWNLGGDERLLKIADGLKKFGFPWSIMGRLDTCNKETFKYLVDRGCVGFRLGVESLSQPLLDKTNKGLKVDFILEMINYLKKLDVSTHLLFMHYILGETEEDRERQNKKIEEIGLSFQNPPCIPFPGTPYYQTVAKSIPGLAKITAWSDYDGGRIGESLKNIVKKYSEGAR